MLLFSFVTIAIDLVWFRRYTIMYYSKPTYYLLVSCCILNTFRSIVFRLLSELFEVISV